LLKSGQAFPKAQAAGKACFVLQKFLPRSDKIKLKAFDIVVLIL
jgi:hypothetical protein